MPQLSSSQLRDLNEGLLFHFEGDAAPVPPRARAAPGARLPARDRAGREAAVSAAPEAPEVEVTRGRSREIPLGRPPAPSRPRPGTPEAPPEAGSSRPAPGAKGEASAREAAPSAPARPAKQVRFAEGHAEIVYEGPASPPLEGLGALIRANQTEVRDERRAVEAAFQDLRRDRSLSTAEKRSALKGALARIDSEPDLHHLGENARRKLAKIASRHPRLVDRAWLGPERPEGA